MWDRVFAAYGNAMWVWATAVNAVEERVAAEAARKREASGIDLALPWITAEMTEGWG